MSIPSDLTGIIERFVAGAVQPALLDPGSEPLPLIREQWSVSEWNGRVIFQAWNTERNLVRKVVGIKEQKRDRISFMTERFAKAPGEMQIADLAAPAGVELGRKTSRTAFRDRFRLMLAREYPDWRVEEISVELNLEQSLTASYARAFLRSGSMGIAAIAAPPDTTDPAGIVAFGLIWLDYLRRREKALRIRQLILYLPLHSEQYAAARAVVIDRLSIECVLCAYDRHDRVGQIELTDNGNLGSTLPPCRKPIAPNAEAPGFQDLDGVDRVHRSDGSISLRVRGLEFARWSAGKLTCGIGRRRAATIETVAAMAREVVRVRCDSAEDRRHPLYSQFPEGWLESQVRANPQAIDASLLRAPLYGQVPIFGGADRGVIDLLGVDHTGRLVVVELKATGDLQLPFQAIDYWLRVRKHLMAGDFERLGYFPGIPISGDAPRILLVAPSLEFHSTSETVIGSLAPQIEITRVGLSADWRRELRVMFRLRGAERPL